MEASQGFRISELEDLAEGVTLFEVEAPRVAKRHRAGQFVIVRPRASSERIPLTIADSDPARGTITLVVQAIGKTTIDLCRNFRKGDVLAGVAGPLGNPTHIGFPGKPDDFRGTVACVAGGIGAAPMLPIAKAFRDAGNEVISILGARRSDLFVLVESMSFYSNEVLFTTDDGSYGRKGFVTDAVKSLVENRREKNKLVDLVVAIGPAVMMKNVAATTKPLGIPTLVSLNTIMVDGTGMCGGCRVRVGGESAYVCVDGPEFDGHKVDWDIMMRRLGTYRAEEKASIDRWRATENKPCPENECRAVAAASTC